jgi:hypothetical protein
MRVVVICLLLFSASGCAEVAAQDSGKAIQKLVSMKDSKLIYVSTGFCDTCKCCDTRRRADLELARRNLSAQQLSAHLIAVPRAEIAALATRKVAKDGRVTNQTRIARGESPDFCEACGGCCTRRGQLNWAKFKNNQDVARLVMKDNNLVITHKSIYATAVREASR